MLLLQGYNARQGILPSRQTKRRASTSAASSSPATKRARTISESSSVESEEDSPEESDDTATVIQQSVTSPRKAPARQCKQANGGRSTVNTESSPPSTTIQITIEIAYLQERILVRTLKSIEKNLPYEKLMEYFKEIVTSELSQDVQYIRVKLLEYDKTGDELEVLLTSDCLQQFPLEKDTRVKVYASL
jgi:hypothetical protein